MYRFAFARQLRWAIPLSLFAVFVTLIVIDYNLEQSAMRAAILGIPAAIAITAIVCAWSIRYQPCVLPPEQWQQSSFDGQKPVTFRLTCRGPAAAVPSDAQIHKVYAKRFGWSVAYTRRSMTMVDDETPVENAPQLLAEVTAARKDAVAAEERSRHFQEESQAKDTRILGLETTVDELIRRYNLGSQSALPEIRSTHPADTAVVDSNEPTREGSGEGPLPGEENRGRCDLCRTGNRRRYHLVGVKLPKDPDPERRHTMDLCVGGCSIIAVDQMDGTIVPLPKAKEAKGARATAKATPEVAKV